VRVTVDSSGGPLPDQIDVLPPERMRELNAALGDRLSSDIRDHFRVLEGRGNRHGWTPREHFWADQLRATQLASSDASGAVVNVGDRRYPIHYFGGTVEPVEARYLTIPLHERAYRRRASVLNEALVAGGHSRLFRPRRRGGGRANVLVSANPEGELTAYYALAESADIPADPDAWPSDDLLQEGLDETTEDFLSIVLR